MIKNIFKRLFLEERSSISLSLYRIAVALTVIFYVVPTLIQFDQNYLEGAFKTFDTSFSTVSFIELVQNSPNSLRYLFLVMFCVFSFTFLVGFFSQFSAILLFSVCQYFYALNAFHLSSLSWYIMMTFLFVMCLTNYHGDYFSIDSLLANDQEPYLKRRPYYIQRILQFQIGFIFFYTALHKITVKGNWLTENPIYYLMNYPSEGVVKTFILKDVLYDKPEWCYAIGVFIVITELLLIVFLFWRKTRLSAIYAGFIFHIVLILTLDVPAVFFFLFPPTLLLFINSDWWITHIMRKRGVNSHAPLPELFYDGNCTFCLGSLKLIKKMDPYNCVRYVNMHTQKDFSGKHAGLTRDAMASQMHLLFPDGALYGGFFAFRKLSFSLPMLYLFIPILYLPGMGFIGSAAYKFIANNRYLFHFGKKCNENNCYR